MFTKTISSLLITAIMATNVFVILPQDANAQAALQVPVKDAAVGSTGCGVSLFGICVPFTSLDGFAWFAAKVIIQQLTADVVNWINSGFDGNPAFMSNPGGFFTNIVDEQIGLMIEQSPDLNFLCSPYSIDIRLALAFKYRPFRKKVTCTLSDIISNSQNAIAGASINGFTAGDFSQGGWPAFLSLSTEPQNNIYGAYLEAENELSIRIGNKELLRRDELNQGRGFISWKKCTRYADEEVAVEGGYSTDPETGEQLPTAGGSASADTDAAGSGTASGKRICAPGYEEVQTPGSVIENSLTTHLGSGVRQLELADSFNEITNALVAQLINQVLQKGLRAASGGGPSDINSYINQLEQDRALQNEQLNSIKNDVIPKINNTLQTETLYRNIKTVTVTELIDARQGLENVKSCYIAKIESENPALNQSQKQTAQKRIEDIDKTLQESINPLAGPLLSDLDRVNKNIEALNAARTSLNSATTVNDAYPPTQAFGKLTEGETLHTTTDITEATVQRDQVISQMSTINSDTVIKLQECQLFP